MSREPRLSPDAAERRFRRRKGDLAPAHQAPYMDSSWWRRLRDEIARTSMGATAARLGVTTSAVSQVFNGSGLYATYGAEKFGERVRLMLDISITCPFLTATAGEEKLIAGDQCREYAYREAPTASPMATRHWRACRSCARRVPAPRGWDERAGRFVIDIKPARGAPAAATGVAAPADQEEAQ